MKYKVGDKVRIKSLEYLKSVNDYEKQGRSYGWNDDMYNYAGSIGVIRNVYDKSDGRFYDFSEVGYMWAEDYLEDVDNEENKKTPKYKVGDKVRIKSRKLIKGYEYKLVYGGWVPDMLEYGGIVCTVKHIFISQKGGVFRCAYNVNEIPWAWDECLLEDVEENTEETENNTDELKEKYKEIFRLRDLLEVSEIPFTFTNFENVGFQLCYPNNEERKRVVSVFEHKYSWGSKNDRLEIKGLLTKEEQANDDVVGNLTAEEVFERIQKHYYGID